MQSKTLRALQWVPDLPNGLSSPDSVSLHKLSIAIHLERATWTTQYYDLDHLPTEVRTITQVASWDLDLETPPQSVNWHPPLPVYRH